MKRTLIPYKSYVFKDKDPVIDLMRTAVADSGFNHTQIKARSGVSPSTLRGWFKKDTKRPQFATVNAVARAIGREFVLQDAAVSRPKLKIVKR